MTRQRTRPTPRSSDQPSIELRLYVAGGAPNSQRARANVNAALASANGVTVALSVVDVFEHPDLALENEVYVTPMLVRMRPGPPQRIVGTLNDREALLDLLRDNDGTRSS